MVMPLWRLYVATLGHSHVEPAQCQEAAQFAAQNKAADLAWWKNDHMASIRSNFASLAESTLSHWQLFV